MKQLALVTEITDNTVLLTECEHAHCKNCGNALCKTQTRSFPAQNKYQLDLRPGDKVEILLDPSKTIASGFIVLVLPLLLFIAFYLGIQVIGIEKELPCVLAGLVGLAGGFLMSFFTSKKGNLNKMPVILKKMNA